MPRSRPGTPTIADVARECGVGTMTVSRVINGGSLVSRETAERVRAAIKKLGYEPNEAARVLKGQAARAIGLIVPELADPFFSACANAVQQLAMQNGYMTVLLAAGRDRESEARELASMKSRNIAGILIVPSDEGCIEPLKKLRAHGIPVVMLDRTFPGVDAGQVMVENSEGMQKAANHLIEHGHRSILCVGYDRQFNSIAQRIAGYEKALADAGLKPQYAVVDEASALAPAVLKSLRSPHPPTALLTLNNVSTTQVLATLQREEMQIPSDVALIGFDDFDLAPLLAVPVTAIRQPAAELGRSATRMLFDLMRLRGSEARPTLAQITLPTELVIRRSCGCAAMPNFEFEDRRSSHREVGRAVRPA